MLVINLMSLQGLVQLFLMPGGRWLIGSNVVLGVMTIVILAVFHNIVITESIYFEIKARSVTDPLRFKARSYFIIYAIVTVVLTLISLIVVIVK